MNKKVRIGKVNFISAIIFSIITMIGIRYNKKLGSGCTFLFVGILSVPLFYYGIIIIKKVIKKICKFLKIRVLCALLGVLWFGNILLCYPASSVPFDSFYIIGEYFNLFPKANNHPYLIVIIMGFFMKLGQVISDNFGIFLYVLLQTAVMYIAVILAVKYMQKWNVNELYIKAMLLLYCISPLYTIYTAVDRKDVLFSAIVYIYCIFFTDSIAREKENDKPITFAIEILSAILAVLLRHNGIFIILISQLFRIIYQRKIRIVKNIFSLFAITIIYLITNNYIYAKIGVEPIAEYRSYACMNADRFQETARYVIKHEAELSERDIAIICEMFGSVENMYMYTPDNGDNIMSLSYREHTKTVINEYNKMWLRQFCDDPAVYISAHLNYTYLYMYPFEIPQNSIFSISEGSANTGEFNIYRANLNEKYVTHLEKNFWHIANVPGINAMLSAGFYFWMLLYCVIYAIEQKRVYLLTIFSVIIAQSLICIFGFMPVNGAIHYAFPIILISPFIVGMHHFILEKN